MSFSYSRTTERSPTKFSQFSDDFYMSEDGYLKQKDIPKDDQAVIDSYFETRLEAILDLFSDQINGALGYSVEFSDDVVEIDQQRSDLDKILAVDEMLDAYKASDPANKDLNRDALISKMQNVYNEAVKAYNEKLKGETKDAEEKEAESEG